MPLTIRYLGGPTVALRMGGVHLLTDPTFDPPGDYPVGSRTLTKTDGPVLDARTLGPVDVVLLSHDQHPDNLDRSGRKYAVAAPLVLSTASARERLGEPVQVLANWEYVEIPRPDGDRLRITGVPALHGPRGTEHLVGDVTGFVLSGDGLPTVYISGDNASLDLVHTIADRFGPFDVAVLFAGGAQTALLGDAYLTITSAQAAEATRILDARQVVPAHFEGWAHFTQGADTLVRAFDQAGLSDRLRLLKPGENVDLPSP
jgi:L-ascorbate metabolism protein UlaG (beta-lactamase superfamily)